MPKPHKLLLNLERIGSHQIQFLTLQKGANLPLTSGVLRLHISRANYATKWFKSYSEREPELPSPVGRGWEDRNGKLVATLAMSQPAPDAVMTIIKCNCSRDECKGNCSCTQNDLPCTLLCGCKCEAVKDIDLNYKEANDDGDNSPQ